jgi:hypothetical protein
MKACIYHGPMQKKATRALACGGTWDIYECSVPHRKARFVAYDLVVS